jgi:Cdc6-like AAA superfamily ATPase
VAERPTFVAREGELERLDRFLNRALAGQGLVCLVTGEAGSGKTALLGKFAQRAQERHRDLVVAIGQGDAQTGACDPYLPFREMLGQPDLLSCSPRCWGSPCPGDPRSRPRTPARARSQDRR